MSERRRRLLRWLTWPWRRAAWIWSAPRRIDYSFDEGGSRRWYEDTQKWVEREP